jgi:hypothetical protein
VTAEPSLEDIAALREQGDLHSYFRDLLGVPAIRLVKKTPEPAEPSYHIPRPGAWPCGTAASGPTPAPCNDCQSGETK